MRPLLYRRSLLLSPTLPTIGRSKITALASVGRADTSLRYLGMALTGENGNQNESTMGVHDVARSGEATTTTAVDTNEAASTGAEPVAAGTGGVVITHALIRGVAVRIMYKDSSRPSSCSLLKRSLCRLISMDSILRRRLP